MNKITIEEQPEITYSSGFALQELPINWKWMLALGVFMLLAGAVGLVASSILTQTSIFVFGGLIFAGGILQIAQGIQAREKDWIGKLQHFLIAILYLLGGLIIVWDPLAASLVLTTILASLFAIMGVTKIWYAICCKRRQWKWLLPTFSGLLNILLAGMIMVSLPESSLWLIGMLVALEMLMNGWFLFWLALRVKNIGSNEVSV